MKHAKLIPIIVLLCATSAFSHAGRTDSQGGHYDRSIGEYHYHHGYSAHRHTNGVCPYDFDDQTDRTGGGDGASTPHKDSLNTETPNIESPKSDPPSFQIGTLHVLAAGFILYWAVRFIKAIHRNRKEQKRLRAERQQYLLQYGGKTKNDIARMCGMPDQVEIGEDGLPKEKSAEGWGYAFTFYISQNGSVFHRIKDCNRAVTHVVHVCRTGTRRPCKKCCRTEPPLSWYWKYDTMMKDIERHGVHPPLNNPPRKPCGTMLMRAENCKSSESVDTEEQKTHLP